MSQLNLVLPTNLCSFCFQRLFQLYERPCIGWRTMAHNHHDEPDIYEEELRELLTYTCPFTGSKRCPWSPLKENVPAKKRRIPGCIDYICIFGLLIHICINLAFHAGTTFMMNYIYMYRYGFIFVFHELVSQDWFGKWFALFLQLVERNGRTNACTAGHECA